jgi:hypothetical protein
VVPRDGEAALDLVDPATVAGLEAAARASGDGWRVPVNPAATDARLTPYPLRPTRERLALRNPAAAGLPRTYIAATERGEAGLVAAVAVGARRARAAGWAYHEVPTGHEPERDAPDAVAALLPRPRLMRTWRPAHQQRAAAQAQAAAILASCEHPSPPGGTPRG